jgi:hypothetical protein
MAALNDIEDLGGHAVGYHMFADSERAAFRSVLLEWYTKNRRFVRRVRCLTLILARLWVLASGDGMHGVCVESGCLPVNHIRVCVSVSVFVSASVCGCMSE